MFFLKTVNLRSINDLLHLCCWFVLFDLIYRFPYLVSEQLSRCVPGVSGSLAGRHFGKPAIVARHILVRSRTGGSRAQRSCATRTNTCLFSTHPVKITSNNRLKRQKVMCREFVQFYRTQFPQRTWFLAFWLTSYGENFLNWSAARRSQISAILCKAVLEFDTKWFTEEITIWKEKR